MSAQNLSLETNYQRVSSANPVWHVWLGKYTEDQDNVVTRDQGFTMRCDEFCPTPTPTSPFSVLELLGDLML